MTIIGLYAARQFTAMWQLESLVASQSLTKILKLSQYHGDLEGTNGDSEIYRFEGEKKGGSILILGGTHPNEPAGYVTANLIIENIRVSQGAVFVVPRANNSGFTHNDPQEGTPQYFSIQGKKALRKFRYGSRITNPVDQWPDPDIYLHYPSGQRLAGNETRNLNRAYPGRSDGTLTEQVAYAIVKLIKQEKIALAIDLHEAAPEYPVVNAIVSTLRSQDIATEAALELAFKDLQYSLEPSPYNFHGLSHREWENYTETLPILMETANPIQGRLRGKTDERLIIDGQDKMYLRAAKLGVLSVPYNSAGLPLKLRVGRHLEAINEIIEIFSKNNPENAISVSGLPSLHELEENGLNLYF
jgi:hypothetical protein